MSEDNCCSPSNFLCVSEGACGQYNGQVICTRTRGHKGDHVACVSNIHNLAVWPNLADEKAEQGGSQKDGGPAFPIPASNLPGSYEADPGMSVRAYMATKAMAAMINAEWCIPTGRLMPAPVAEEACKFADALIAELNKEAK